MQQALYVSAEYADTQPAGHADHAARQAAHVLRMMGRHEHLAPASIIELGSGSGDVLLALAGQLPDDVLLTGFQCSPQACIRTSSRLHFEPGNGLSAQDEPADLALALNVMADTQDAPALLTALAGRARYTILEMPLELSLLNLLTGLPLGTSRGAGRAQHFTRASALAVMEDSGLRVLDDFLVEAQPRARGALARLPRLALAAVNQNLAAMLLGGFSLMVLAEAKESR